MIAVMAAKATRIKRMANIIRMRAPIDFHFGKDIRLINFLHFDDRFSDRLPLFLVNGRVLLEIKIFQSGCDALARTLFARKILTEQAHGLPFDVGQCRVNQPAEKGCIDRAIRIAKDMARSVMTVDAVHAAQLKFFELFCAEGSRALEVFCNASLPILNPDPGNFLPLRIGRTIPHFVSDIHVPVDS